MQGAGGANARLIASPCVRKDAVVTFLLNSAIPQQLRHHPTAEMRDPGLLQELPDIRHAALLADGGGDREQAAAADGTTG